MNKFKKLAVAAVSVAMAGTMALSFAACGGGGEVYQAVAVKRPAVVDPDDG